METLNAYRPSDIAEAVYIEGISLPEQTETSSEYIQTIVVTDRAMIIAETYIITNGARFQIQYKVDTKGIKSIFVAWNQQNNARVRTILEDTMNTIFHNTLELIETDDLIHEALVNFVNVTRLN